MSASVIATPNVWTSRMLNRPISGKLDTMNDFVGIIHRFGDTKSLWIYIKQSNIVLQSITCFDGPANLIHATHSTLLWYHHQLACYLVDNWDTCLHEICHSLTLSSPRNTGIVIHQSMPHVAISPGSIQRHHEPKCSSVTGLAVLTGPLLGLLMVYHIENKDQWTDILASPALNVDVIWASVACLLSRRFCSLRTRAIHGGQ